MTRAHARRRGFSLTELLIAILILGLGIIGIAALFPAGIAQQRDSVDDVIGPVVADNAMALLRSRLSQEDFGTFEEFVGSLPVPQLPMTIRGDWPWMRPSFVLQGSNTAQRGSVDIFSRRYTRLQVGQNEENLLLATELPGGVPLGNPSLWGIPYNRARYGFTGSPDRPEPRVEITQQERFYPMVSSWDPDPPRPQYVWDCMFRRFQGRIHVAIFVYRVSQSGRGDAPWITPPNPLHNTATGMPGPVMPPLPVVLDLTSLGSDWDRAWDAWGLNFNDPGDNAYVFGLPAGTTYDRRQPLQSWQEAGQWILDQNNNVHRVLSRNRTSDAVNQEIELVRPVPVIPRTGFADVYFYDTNLPPAAQGVTNITTHLWYIPTEVQIDTDGDGTPNSEMPVELEPVYVTVREL